MRKRIYRIIEASDGNDILSSIYDYFMIIVIFASLFHLAFKNSLSIFETIDKVAVAIFIADYILRWATADIKYNDNSISSFFKYPFSLMAIVDLISILPSLTILNTAFKTLRIIRLIRCCRILRVFKTFRYSKNIQIIFNVMKKSRNSLIAVCILAIGYVLIAALVIFNVEPETFDTFFDAIYWATVSLTTMGYGDIYPISNFGRLVTMFSSFVGIAIVALPASIITAGYMKEINESEK